MTHNRKAFTLIEVLIVVIIMAVLAATIIPQFSSSTEDAKRSTLDFNLHTIRSQIEMYKIHHLGQPPTLDNFARQMTEPTNAKGGFDGDTPYGPYIQGEIPVNPFNHSNVVAAGTGDGEVAGGAGWQYNESTGGFWPNNEEWWSEPEDED